jgi:hypothetical protein
MAKKAKKKKRKKSRKLGTDPSTFQTGEAIVGLWTDSINNGLGIGKKLHKDIPDKFKQPLIDFVQSRLDGKPPFLKPEVFTKDDEKCTKQVAKDLGKICKMLKPEKKEIPLDTFEPAYRLVQHFHDVCGGAGGGVWCEGGA